MTKESIELIGRTIGTILGIIIFFGPWLMIPSWIVTHSQLGDLAKEYGIRRNWLTWIPLVNAWIPGSISDAYRQTVQEKKSSRRKVLVILRILRLVLWGLFCFCVAKGYADAAAVKDQGATDSIAKLMMVYAIIDGLWFMVPALVLDIVGKVLWYMALYDVYRAFLPRRCVWYLVLSLIPAVNLITKPLLLSTCKGQQEESESNEQTDSQVPEKL